MAQKAKTNKKAASNVKTIDPARVIQTADDVAAKGAKPLFKGKMPDNPIIVFTAKAWHQMYTLIPLAKKMNTEVTWYCPIIEETDDLGQLTVTVPEIFVPKQEVSFATCEEVEWGAVLNEAFERGYNPDVMKGWCHLHPGSSVSPSTTDEEQTQDLMENWDTMLRGIFSECGNYKVDYYDANSGYIFQNLDVEIHYPEEFEMDRIHADFKERVRKHVNVQPKYPVTQYGNNYGNNYGTRRGVSGKSTAQKKNSSVDNISDHWTQQDIIDGYDYDVSGGNSSVHRLYIATIHGTSSFVDCSQALIVGEDVEITSMDGVSSGYTVLTAYEEDLVDMREVICCIKDIDGLTDDMIATHFPNICMYFDLEEKADLEEEQKKQAQAS